jgi:hypothetical protein
MMGDISFGLGLLCAAMMALMCLPMAIGVIGRRRRRQHTAPAPSAEPASRHAASGAERLDPLSRSHGQPGQDPERALR